MKRWAMLLLTVVLIAPPILGCAQGVSKRNKGETQESLHKKYGFQIWTLPDGIEMPEIKYWAIVDTRYDGRLDAVTDSMLRLFGIDPDKAEKRVRNRYRNNGFKDTDYVLGSKTLRYGGEWNGFRYFNNVVGGGENGDQSGILTIGITPEESLRFAQEQISKLFGEEYVQHPLPFSPPFGTLTGDRLKELDTHTHRFDAYYEGLPVAPTFSPAIRVAVGRLASSELYIRLLHYSVSTYRGDETVQPPEHVITAAEAMDRVIEVRKKYCTGPDGYEVREGEALGYVRAVYTNFDDGGDVFRPAWCFTRADGSDIFVDMATGEVDFDR